MIMQSIKDVRKHSKWGKIFGWALGTWGYLWSYQASDPHVRLDRFI